MKWRASLLCLAALVGSAFVSGCNPKANEAEDVQDAQEKVKEEQRDLANED